MRRHTSIAAAVAAPLPSWVRRSATLSLRAGAPWEGLLRTVGIPLTYRGIAADIEARIAAGEYPPGSKIPTYAHLARLYCVHPTTIQLVVAVLKERGSVLGSPGRGVFVPDQPAEGEGPR